MSDAAGFQAMILDHIEALRENSRMIDEFNKRFDSAFGNPPNAGGVNVPVHMSHSPEFAVIEGGGEEAPGSLTGVLRMVRDKLDDETQGDA